MTKSEIMAAVREDFANRREIAQEERRVRREQAYARVPQLREIDERLYKLGADNLLAIMKEPDRVKELNDNLVREQQKLKALRDDLARKNGIDPEFDRLRFRCEKCKDTGYLDDYRQCTCMKQAVINARYASSGLLKRLEKENFSTFDFSCYSERKNENGESDRERMLGIYKRARRLCDNFDNEEKSLLFYGAPGRGKTFLSNCIAKELMDKGKTVVYVRAPRLFNRYEDYKFGRIDESDYFEGVFDCDLLIIDDLGTEAQSKYALAFLDDILNERLNSGRKMVISTNLNTKELTQVYSQRFISRVFGHFLVCRFEGADIRVQRM